MKDKKSISMKKKDLQTLIEFFALLAGWCLIVGMANCWFTIGTMLFGGAAAVTKLFYIIAKD